MVTTNLWKIDNDLHSKLDINNVESDKDHNKPSINDSLLEPVRKVSSSTGEQIILNVLLSSSQHGIKVVGDDRGQGDTFGQKSWRLMDPGIS